MIDHTQLGCDLNVRNKKVVGDDLEKEEQGHWRGAGFRKKLVPREPDRVRRC